MVIRWHIPFLVIVLLACAALRLWPIQFEYFHPDEVISVEVARHVVETGSLDTNWKDAALPVDFKLPQYNFSAYLLSAAFVDGLEKAFAGAQRDTLKALRVWSVVLSVLATGLTFFVGRAFFGTVAGLIAAVLVTLNPLLAQDAFYARPEPFVTALTLLVLWGGHGRATGARLFLTALVVGLLVATKISMLGLIPLLFLPRDETHTHQRFWRAVLAYTKQARHDLPRRAAAALPGVLIGFVLGAPFALVHSGDYTTGVEFLIRQYSTPQWPYGLGEATFAQRLVYVGDYLGTTTGALVLALSVAGAVWAGAQRNFRALGVFALTVIVAVRFATYPTFFERNLSHLIPIILIFAAYGSVRVCALVAARLTSARPWLAPATLVVGLAIVLIPAVRMTTLLLAVEISGKSRAELNKLRREVAVAHGVEPTLLSGDQNYAELAERNFHHCGPWLLEVVHFHSARSDAALPRVSAEMGFREVGRFVSKFAYVPAGSIHTYLTPTIVFLFREADAAVCEADGTVVDPRRAQEKLELVSLAPDASWTERGAFPLPAPFTPADFYGSWSGADANMGSLRMTLRVNGQTEIALPYTTGPSGYGQSLRVSDKESGREIWKMDPLQTSSQWTYARIPLPPETREILVEATDNGAEWGQWHAVAPPRIVAR